VYVPADGSSMKLRKTTPTGEALKAEDEPGMFMKERLREIVKQIVGRDLIESDISYECTVAPSGGHVYRVSIPALPDGSWKKVWVGAVSPFKRDAQLIAAEAACTDLCNDPVFGLRIDKVKLDEMDKMRVAKKEAKKQANAVAHAAYKGKGKGKEGLWMMKGKGNVFDEGQGWWDPWTMWMMKGKGKGEGKGKGAWGGAGSGACTGEGRNKRRRLTTSPMTGTVVEWKEKYGWINPHTPVTHPAAQKNMAKAGMVFVSVKDLVGERTSLDVGSTVSFMLCADTAGVRGEEVTCVWY